MQFRTILTLIVAAVACGVQAQSRGDDLILDMNQAYKRGDTRKLSQMLPQLRGHALEPWAAYWELRARLDSASVQEIQDFMSRYAGTYQEDRLRNDWLLMLGQRRDWTTFEAEYPKFRMNDDREVRCYALLVQHITQGAAAPATLADEVRRNWFAQREADERLRPCGQPADWRARRPPPRGQCNRPDRAGRLGQGSPGYRSQPPARGHQGGGDRLARIPAADGRTERQPGEVSDHPRDSDVQGAQGADHAGPHQAGCGRCRGRPRASWTANGARS